jgi:transposase
VGLDVHKDGISVAAAESGRTPGRLIGKVTHDLNKLLKVLTKVGSAEQLHLGTRLFRRASVCSEP